MRKNTSPQNSDGFFRHQRGDFYVGIVSRQTKFLRVLWVGVSHDGPTAIALWRGHSYARGADRCRIIKECKNLDEAIASFQEYLQSQRIAEEIALEELS